MVFRVETISTDSRTGLDVEFEISPVPNKKGLVETGYQQTAYDGFKDSADDTAFTLSRRGKDFHFRYKPLPKSSIRGKSQDRQTFVKVKAK